MGWGHKFIEWVYSAKAAEPDAEGPTPEQQCVAIADSWIRFCNAADNLPDLQVAFETGQRKVKECQATAGTETVRRELDRLIAAKDLRKAAFGVAPAAPITAPGEEISPEDLVNLETLISDAGVDPADVKERFHVLRLASIPLSGFGTVQDWIIENAGKRGIALAAFKHQPSPPPAEKSPREVLDDTVTRIGNARGGLFGESSAAGPSDGGLATMDDDLPWEDGAKK